MNPQVYQKRQLVIWVAYPDKRALLPHQNEVIGVTDLWISEIQAFSKKFSLNLYLFLLFSVRLMPVVR